MSRMCMRPGILRRRHRRRPLSPPTRPSATCGHRVGSSGAVVLGRALFWQRPFCSQPSHMQHGFLRVALLSNRAEQAQGLWTPINDLKFGFTECGGFGTWGLKLPCVGCFSCRNAAGAKVQLERGPRRVLQHNRRPLCWDVCMAHVGKKGQLKAGNFGTIPARPARRESALQDIAKVATATSGPLGGAVAPRVWGVVWHASFGRWPRRRMVGHRLSHSGAFW